MSAERKAAGQAHARVLARHKPGPGPPGNLGLPPDRLWAVSALISDAAAAAWIDPGRVSFTKAVRIVRRAVGPAFPPRQADGVLARAMAEITRKPNLNPI